MPRKSTTKITKEQLALRIGTSRSKTLQRYAAKQKALSRKDRFLERLKNSLQILENSKKKLPSHNHPAYGMLHAACVAVERACIHADQEIDAEYYEPGQIFPGDKVRLIGQYKGTSWEQYAGKVWTVLDEIDGDTGEYYLKSRTHKIALPASSLRRVALV